MKVERGDYLINREIRACYMVRTVHKDGTITLVEWVTEKYIGRFSLDYIDSNFEKLEKMNVQS